MCTYRGSITENEYIALTLAAEKVMIKADILVAAVLERRTVKLIRDLRDKRFSTSVQA